MGTYFSDRHGFRANRPIVVRDAAPEPVRVGIVYIAHESGLRFADIRATLCRVLNRLPDPNNWSEVPNLRDEVFGMIAHCPWYRVYDTAEVLAHELATTGREHDFEARFNLLCEEEGIGWQMVGCEVVARGTGEFERTVQRATDVLQISGRNTAAHELEEARRDLSRRPHPDTTGTIQHSMAALECLARDLSGQTETLGTTLRRGTLRVPPPLDAALERIWGYASDRGRHLREGRTPGYAEAELILGLAAATVTYLLSRTTAVADERL